MMLAIGWPYPTRFSEEKILRARENDDWSMRDDDWSMKNDALAVGCFWSFRLFKVSLKLTWPNFSCLSHFSQVMTKTTMTMMMTMTRKKRDRKRAKREEREEKWRKPANNKNASNNNLQYETGETHPTPFCRPPDAQLTDTAYLKLVSSSFAAARLPIPVCRRTIFSIQRRLGISLLPILHFCATDVSFWTYLFSSLSKITCMVIVKKNR